jgi:hypothetical protein
MTKERESQKFHDKQSYERTMKPLLEEGKYGIVSDLIHRNPTMSQYLTKQELRDMGDYYRKVLYTLTSGLELLTKRMEAMHNE